METPIQVGSTPIVCITIASVVLYMALFVYLVVLASRFVMAFESIARNADRVANKYNEQVRQVGDQPSPFAD